MLNIFFSVPSPVVTVSPMELVLVSGSSLSLTCSIQPVLFDTTTNIMSSWTTPGHKHDTMNVGNTTLELTKDAVETVDNGMYVCSATVVDTSSSPYILDSKSGISIANITVSKFKASESMGFKLFFLSTELHVTVSAIYTSAPGEDRGKFTAASVLVLMCSVKGNNNSLTYMWSVMGHRNFGDCSGCSIDTSSTIFTLTVGGPLYSYHTGEYMCNVSESNILESNNADSFSVSVVGEFTTLVHILHSF